MKGRNRAFCFENLLIGTIQFDIVLQCLYFYLRGENIASCGIDRNLRCCATLFQGQLSLQIIVEQGGIA